MNIYSSTSLSLSVPVPVPTAARSTLRLATTAVAAAVTVMSAVTLVGCSTMFGIGESKFTCEKLRGQVISDPAAAAVCGGVKAVYRETNSRAVLPNPRDMKTTPASANAAPVPATPALPTRIVSVPAPVAHPKPIMEPAQVARVWINYWIDSRGDLHQPGLLYSEITPRRWAVGQPGSPAIRDVQPFQVMRDGEDVGSTQPPTGGAIKVNTDPLKPKGATSLSTAFQSLDFPSLTR